jgi:hypothetical protein
MTTPNGCKSRSHAPEKARSGTANAKTPRAPDLVKQFEDIEFRLFEFMRTLGAYPQKKAVLRNAKRHAAAVGPRMQKLALMNATRLEDRHDPLVHEAYSQDDFMFEIRRYLWDSIEMLSDNKSLEPQARLRLLRRRLWNRGRCFELLAKAKLFDRAALIRLIQAADTAPDQTS